MFILDEIDKVSQANVNGDPSAALLEVLDPEQNNTFHDNFLDIDYDLSKVMFIATANNIGNIPAPLLDRMELIEVSGYLTEEKIEIAKRHLVPKELENLGMEKKELKISKGALEKIIESTNCSERLLWNMQRTTHSQTMNSKPATWPSILVRKNIHATNTKATSMPVL